MLVIKKRKKKKRIADVRCFPCFPYRPPEGKRLCDRPDLLSSSHVVTNLSSTYFLNRGSYDEGSVRVICGGHV